MGNMDSNQECLEPFTCYTAMDDRVLGCAAASAFGRWTDMVDCQACAQGSKGEGEEEVMFGEVLVD
jgi:hypothetical protein